jgi:segregation and condensation protein A
MVTKTESAGTRIFDMLFKEDEISWQSMIYSLIEEENMDPWDIDVSLLSKKFLQKVRKLKEMDFRISGKVILASALLLKIKSKRLLDTEIVALDNLINNEEPIDLLDELAEGLVVQDTQEKPKLVPRTPQPRVRKISVYDLVDALEKALKLEQRRKHYKKPEEVTVKAPQGDEKDIQTRMKEILAQATTYFKSNPVINFDQLLPGDSKEDKVYTFVPLLHLENQRALNLIQKQHFGPINIKLLLD